MNMHKTDVLISAACIFVLAAVWLITYRLLVGDPVL